MAAASPDALLSYGVSPSSVHFSGGPDALSVVALSLTVSNPTDAPVACRSITFTIQSGLGDDALTVDPTAITASAGTATPWAFWGGGDGSWRAVPLPPATGLAAGETITLQLGNIVVNQLPGAVSIAVDEVSDQPRTATIALTKACAAPQSQVVPAIESFTALPAQVAQGGTVTIAWQVSGAISCALEPGPIALLTPAGGTLPLQVQKTTLYTLRAVGSGGAAGDTATVAVMPVAIDSFDASAGTVAPGAQVTLAWKTRFASQCSIDQGVGPVAGSGSVQVQPQQTTTYTLTAQGLEPLTRSVTVLVWS